MSICESDNSTRKITEFEEQVIRACHHDHSGMTQAEAAVELVTSQSLIARAMRSIKAKAPQLFPILTKRQKQIFDFITEDGLTHEQVSLIMGISRSTVEGTIETMRLKGVKFIKPAKTIPYKRHMDGDIRLKF